MRRYSCHILGSRGRFFRAGEDVPDDVPVAPFAEKYRLPDDEQPDESNPPQEHTTITRARPPRSTRSDLTVRRIRSFFNIS
jgi:hypothetical protein